MAGYPKISSFLSNPNGHFHKDPLELRVIHTWGIGSLHESFREPTANFSFQTILIQKATPTELCGLVRIAGLAGVSICSYVEAATYQNRRSSKHFQLPLGPI
uniref:Uncharacterized protein n=1 Tax=Crocodylus porosus TaxID=8502 RepID=A0A7M4FCN8_CROPO